MESIWSKTSHLQKFPALQGDLTTEAAVIGGGLAGILIAFFLRQHNVNTIVLEADKIGSGQTQNTTAKITSQHNVIYSKLIKDFGEDKARQYAQANQQAIEEYRRIIQGQNIDCFFKECPSYLYSQSPEDIQMLEQETDAASRLGIHAEFTTQTELPFSVAGAVKFYGQAQFHPLDFLQSISESLNIFENTKVITVEDNRILTEHGTVTAKHIIFASHFPFLNMPGFYFARMHQERSYVLALEKAAELEGMYLGVDTEALSFRSFHDTLLLGGGGHRTGENSAGGKYSFLREKSAQFYPQSKEITQWSAQDCMTLDSVPYIGQFASSTPNWYVATGFGKWGMTSSMVAAMLISGKIAGIDYLYGEIFSPLRFTPAPSAKTFLTEAGQAIKGLSKQVFSLPQENVAALPAGHGGVVEYNDKKIGVYKDEQENIFAVSIRCPHLGCQLEWNPDEKSWDCPCHGSRFDYKGNLLNNPAQVNLEVITNE